MFGTVVARDTPMLKIAIAVCLIGACSYEYEYERLGGKSVQKELCPTGCNSEVEEALATALEWEQLDDKVFVNADDSKVFDDPCAMLPTEGVCAYVCDPEEL